MPFVALADGLPVPVEEIDDGFWVLRDDLTDSHYGGNKVRKLEFCLAVALRRGGPVLTAGATGSHHALATAVHAGRLGLDVEVVRFPQPATPHVEDVAACLRALDNVHTIDVPHPYLMPPMLALRRVFLERQGGYALLPGATSPLGVLGYVSAGIELADAFARGGWEEPDEVVVALGSGGTAVGLALGLRLAGWDRAVVRAVRVADAIVTNEVVLGAHAAGAMAILAMGGARVRPGRLVVEAGWFGAGYGHPTRAGDAAAIEAGAYGLILEPTYTAKAFAAALARWREGRRVVFVQTLAG